MTHLIQTILAGVILIIIFLVSYKLSGKKKKEDWDEADIYKPIKKAE